MNKDNTIVFYKGRGNHSVAELEEMVFKLKEKEHYIDAPYAQSCLNRLEVLLSNRDIKSEDERALRLIELYFKGILGK